MRWEISNVTKKHTVYYNLDISSFSRYLMKLFELFYDPFLWRKINGNAVFNESYFILKIGDFDMASNPGNLSYLLLNVWYSYSFWMCSMYFRRDVWVLILWQIHFCCHWLKRKKNFFFTRPSLEIFFFFENYRQQLKSNLKIRRTIN